MSTEDNNKAMTTAYSVVILIFITAFLAMVLVKIGTAWFG